MRTLLFALPPTVSTALRSTVASEGTTSVTVLCGELLREAEQLVNQRLHPQVCAFVFVCSLKCSSVVFCVPVRLARFGCQSHACHGIVLHWT